MTDTINNGIPFVPENTVDPAAGLNLSLNVIDALLQLSVVSMGQTTPPAGVEGERHIVGVGATGDWAGQDNKLARYLDGMWHFYDAKLAVYDGKVYAFDGTDWATALVGDDLKTINGQSIIGSGDLTVTGVVNSLNDVGDVDAPTPSDGDALVYNSVSGNWEATTVGGTGTVTSVDMTVPTGFTISGNPITGAGTLSLDFDTGYSLVSSTDRAMWDAALQSSDLKTVNGNSLIGSGDITIGATVVSLNDVGDVDAPSPADGEVLAYNSVSGNWEAAAVGGTGTVTSVDISVPTGLTVSGGPITSSGTISIGLDSGYSLVSGTDRATWDGAVQPSGDTISDVTLVEYTETINTTAGATLDRSTGGIQRLDMTANVTLDLSGLSAGQSVMYRVTGGDTYTLSYTGLGNWSDGNVPTLEATHYLEFVHDGVEIVGFDCGGR